MVSQAVRGCGSNFIQADQSVSRSPPDGRQDADDQRYPAEQCARKVVSSAASFFRGSSTSNSFFWHFRREIRGICARKRLAQFTYFAYSSLVLRPKGAPAERAVLERPMRRFSYLPPRRGSLVAIPSPAGFRNNSAPSPGNTVSRMRTAMRNISVCIQCQLRAVPSIRDSRSTARVVRSDRSNFAREDRSTWRFEKKRGGVARTLSAPVKSW